MAVLRRLAADQSGASAVEYGLAVALVAFGMLAAMQSVGPGLSGLFTRLATTFASL